MGSSSLGVHTLRYFSMNRMILFAALLACAFAKPGYLATPYAAAPYHYGYAAAPYHHGYAGPYNHGYAAPHAYSAVHPGYAPAYASQYHSQDEFGSAAYGHVQPNQAHSAVRDYTGAVRGSYSYINAEGKEIFVDYIADQGGFRVLSNSLPVGPENNLQAPVFEGKAPVFEGKAPVFDLEGPAPVEDTPEVKAAREEHLAAHAKALAAAEAAPDDAEEAPEEDAAERR